MAVNPGHKVPCITAAIALYRVIQRSYRNCWSGRILDGDHLIATAAVPTRINRQPRPHNLVGGSTIC
ncbi:MAG TPA: hypothetical protein PLI89_14260, partial [Chitinophagales bacterium]|nr:hypothetical protein [Chitinophagales bacterium]